MTVQICRGDPLQAQLFCLQFTLPSFSVMSASAAPRPPSSSSSAAGCCTVCATRTPLPVSMHCACRGDAALAHPACKVRAASSGLDPAIWMQCSACSQPYGKGAVKSAMARAFWARATQATLDDAECVEATLLRGIAGQMYASALRDEGDEAAAAAVLAESEGAEFISAMLRSQAKAGAAAAGGGVDGAGSVDRDVMELFVLGNELGEKIETLEEAESFAASEPLHREMMAACAPVLARRALPAQARAMVTDLSQRHARGLGNALTCQGKHAAAEDVLQDVVAEQRRTLGERHREVLETSVILAQVMCMRDDPAEAIALLDELLPALVATRHRILPRAEMLRGMLPPSPPPPALQLAAQPAQQQQRRGGKKKAKRGKKKGKR